MRREAELAIDHYEKKLRDREQQLPSLGEKIEKLERERREMLAQAVTYKKILTWLRSVAEDPA